MLFKLSHLYTLIYFIPATTLCQYSALTIICFLFPFRCRSIFIPFHETVLRLQPFPHLKTMSSQQKSFITLSRKINMHVHMIVFGSTQSQQDLLMESQRTSITFQTIAVMGKLSSISIRFEVTKMLNSVSPHYSTEVHLQQESCQEIRT